MRLFCYEMYLSTCKCNCRRYDRYYEATYASSNHRVLTGTTTLTSMQLYQSPRTLGTCRSIPQMLAVAQRKLSLTSDPDSVWTIRTRRALGPEKPNRGSVDGNVGVCQFRKHANIIVFIEVYTNSHKLKPEDQLKLGLSIPWQADKEVLLSARHNALFCGSVGWSAQLLWFGLERIWLRAQSWMLDTALIDAQQ